MTFESSNRIEQISSLTTEWMKTNEVAEYLKTSPNNVRNLVYKSYLNPKKFMGRLYFCKSEVSQLFNQGANNVD